MLFLLLLLPVPKSDFSFSTAVYAATGELMGAQTAKDGQWRMQPPPDFTQKLKRAMPINLARIDSSPNRGLGRYAQAVVMYEDRRFWGHAGLDARSIIRALRDNFQGKRVVSGASTLSMQCARLLYHADNRRLGQKIREMFLAIRLELHLGKYGIMSLYSSLAPYGANVVGLEAASFRWFGRPFRDCTWAEAATLAVLPNSPGLLHPGRSPEMLEAKRNRLLDALAANGQLSSDDLWLAKKEPLPLKPVPMPEISPHLSYAAAARGETRVETTIDYALQLRANSVVARQSRRLGAQGIRNIAAVLLRVSDGSTAAYIGNVDTAGTAGDKFVDCARARRSSGSILKPFLYAAMLDSGELTPTRLVSDIPTRFGSYSPENNLKTYSGAVRAEDALARSLNVPFARLLRSYGVERFGNLLKRLGFSSLNRSLPDYGLTLILGGAEVSLIDAADAYRQLAQSCSATDSIFSPAAAWLTLEALVHVARPCDEASWQEFASSRQVAWKTGTSFGNRDAWAIGISPDYVVAVWAGNADGEGRPELKGTDAAAPILFDLFQLLPRAPWFPRPMDSMKIVDVCDKSGYRAGPDCAGIRSVLAPLNSQVNATCPYCTLVHLTADGRFRTTAECSPPGQMLTEKRFALPPAMEWYYRKSVIDYKPLPPWQPGCAPVDSSSIEFIAPEQGAILYIPIELDGTPGKTVFRAALRATVRTSEVPQKAARLFWHLDGDYIGATVGDHRMEARPAPGEHELVLVDEYGSRVSRQFRILAREGD